MLWGQKQVVRDRLLMKAIGDGDIRALIYLDKRMNPEPRKKNKEKTESVAHIYHHIDPPPNNEKKTLEDHLQDEAVMRYNLSEEIKAKTGITLTPEQLSEIVRATGMSLLFRPAKKTPDQQ